MHKIAAAVIVLGAGVATADRAQRTAHVWYGTPTVTGTDDTKAISATVKTSQRKYIACYSQALATNPAPGGTANATFTITADGRVTDVDVSGLTNAANKCIAGVIAKLTFAKPKSREAVEVTYPLLFATLDRVAVITGTGVGSSGFAETEIYGGLIGDDSGGSALGRSGFGPPGGGTGWGTIGTGGYAPSSTVSIGQAKVTGDLDKVIIRRYIKRNTGKLGYCYEKELLAKPTLRGTVLVDFTIGGDGRVTSATAAGVDSALAACVADVIKHIEFPTPKGASVVTVAYPVTYSPPPAKPAKAKKRATAKPAPANDRI